MPIFEYVCAKCGKKTEVIQRHSDAPLAECPSCGGKVKKAISAPAIQFKGSGWYVTDYGSGSTKASRSEREAGEGGEKSAEKTGGSEKGEAKEKSGSEKSAKSEKSEKREKSDRSEKGDKKKSSKKGS